VADDIRFDGRVAVVTGAGRGIGREEALLLGRRGARVVVNDWGRRPDGTDATSAGAAEEVVALLRSEGGDAVADSSDVGTAAGAVAVVERALDEWGRIDILVNNAGAFVLADSPGELTDEGIDVTIRTHLLSTLRTCRRAWPAMVAQGYGRIVNTSSATALGVINSWDYPAAKGGVLGYTRSLPVTGASLGINANAIMPMAYTRNMHDYPNEQVRAWMEAHFRPEQVAPAVAFLAHEDVPCTGECLAVGAGRVARIVFMGSPGYQRPDGLLTVEDIRGHWDEVIDLSDAQLLQHSRDESGMYRGPATWSGDDRAYRR
jgi:NAD(P)-dependent dehydrogenase (short-subunit alcohol dehydrogenase family)